MQATQFNRADLGFWPREAGPVSTRLNDLQKAFDRLHEAFYVLIVDGKPAVARPGQDAVALGPLVEPPMAPGTAPDGYPVLAYCPACLPERLGDASFCADHGLRFPYIAGAMANGVGSVEIVEAMSRAGMIGFFGAAGLPLQRVESAIDRIQNSLQTEDGHRPYGANLIHSPAEPGLEDATVDLYLRKGVRLVSASAYLRLTPALIRYRVHGIHRDPNGKIVTPNRVIAKVSRVEIARRFFSPPPEKFLARLVLSRAITAEQAKLAEKIPVAQDLTAEADSGGHTDNRPFLTLLPTMIALRDELQEEFGYEQRLRVGAAGGIATPSGAAAAFSMGAAYILTGTINQACEESGTSPLVRRMLREARQADVAMAPAADMFEMGVKVQVLKRGTMFPMRAAKLYEIYRACESLDRIPSDQKKMLEADFFRGSFDEIWRQTEAFFADREPGQIEKAERDPKHKMALVFRWYLGQSSGWANEGREDRKVDFQVWCGPSMGAFNQWTAGSPLENQEERNVEAVALNLLVGAAVLSRVQSVRAQGVDLPADLSRVRPMALDQAKERLNY